MELDDFTSAFHCCSSNYLLDIGGLTVKQIIITPTKKVQNSAKSPKVQLAASISKNVSIMHKALALREESKFFGGNQFIQDV